MADIENLFFQYYGLDWAAMLFGLSGFYMITRHNRLGFVLQVVASILGFAVALKSGQGGYVVFNLAFVVIASYGYAGWASQQLKPAPIPSNSKS